MDPSTPRPSRCRASEDRAVADHSRSTADPTVLHRDTNAFSTSCAKQFLVVHIFGPYGTRRFAQLRRSVDGISQKVLTNILRSLERDGIVTRRIYASVPPKVEYSLTGLGLSLCDLVEGICCWAEANIEQVQAAREMHARTPRED